MWTERISNARREHAYNYTTDAVVLLGVMFYQGNHDRPCCDVRYDFRIEIKRCWVCLYLQMNCSFFIAFLVFSNIYSTWKFSIDNEAFQQPLPLEYISQLIRYSSTCGSYHDFLDKTLLLTRQPHLWCNCKRARVERLRSARFTPKTIKLVCVASPLIMHRWLICHSTRKHY
jgi:hypothetical protein